MMLSKGSLKLKLTVMVLVSAIAVPSFAKDKKAKPTPTVADELKFKQNDETGNDIKALKTELLISKNDERALEQLKKLMSKYKGTALEPSLHFRLAELYMRRAKTATFFEVHREDNQIVNFTPAATKSSNSRHWIAKAIETYDSVQKRFTHFRDMDLVLFNNAFARQILGQETQAVALYKQVIENFSESPMVPDCHLAVGETLFNAKKFQQAYDEFQKIRKFTDSKVYPYGLYKGAWALYNLRKNVDGLKQLEEVVAYSKAQNSEEGGNHLDLQREALEDMVTFYEDVRKPGDAVSYFRGQAGDGQYGSLILKLGRLYARHGKHPFVEVVYHDLINATPLVAERPQMHKDLFESFEIRQKKDQAVVELEALSSLCQVNSAWSKVQKPEVNKACVEQLEETGKLYAAKWHKEFNKTKNPLLAQYTRRVYESFLNSGFKFSEEDKERYSYADLLFQMNDFRKASKQYSLAAHLTKDGKLKHDSSYAALVSLEKDIKDKWTDQDEETFAVLAADYVTMNPKGQYVTDVKFKKAFIAYEKGKFERAAPDLKELSLNYATTERGKKAAHLYLDILNIQKRYELLRDESAYFIKKLNFDAATKDEFLKIHQQAYFTVVQNLEASKKYSEAVVGYKAFVKDNPKSALADKALVNAVRCANLSLDLTEATKISESLLKDYPNSPQVLEITKALVVLYEAQAQLGQAGRSLLKLAELDEAGKLSHTLAAADYKALNNEWSQALQIYTTLNQKYPNSREGKLALERMAALSEKNGQWEKTERLFRQIIDSGAQPQSSVASFKITKHACESRDDENCFKLAKKVLNMRGEKGVSNWALSQARLLQGKILEKEFDMTGVKAKAERLGMVLKIKIDKLDRVQKAYQDVLNYGDKATAIEALVKLAGVYEKFSNSLHTIEAPADLKEEEKKKFLAEIENIALPIEEKNADNLHLALKQAKDMRLHDGTIMQIQNELNRLARKSLKTKIIVNVSSPENVLPVVN